MTIPKAYVVTPSLVYCISFEKDGRDNPILEPWMYRGDSVKINKEGEKEVLSEFKLLRPGERSEQKRWGTRVAITGPLGLVVYTPKDPATDWTGDLPPNSDWHTKWIAAIFLTKEEAEACFGAGSLGYCDERWWDSTKAALDAIGNNHPVWVVVKGKFELKPRRKEQTSLTPSAHAGDLSNLRT